MAEYLEIHINRMEKYNTDVIPQSSNTKVFVENQTDDLGGARCQLVDGEIWELHIESGAASADIRSAGTTAWDITDRGRCIVCAADGRRRWISAEDGDGTPHANAAGLSMPTRWGDALNATACSPRRI